ncbi:MAG: hypothetical protein U0R51_06315 [Solirubrobacterales bacterium]
MKAVHDRFAAEEIPVPLDHALDVLWEEHQGPLFLASLELWVASRTDPELGRTLHRVEREVGDRLGELAVQALGDVALRPGFGEDLVVVLATIRGLAMLGISDGGSGQTLAEYWLHTRTWLVRVLAGTD